MAISAAADPPVAIRIEPLDGTSPSVGFSVPAFCPPAASSPALALPFPPGYICWGSLVQSLSLVPFSFRLFLMSTGGTALNQNNASLRAPLAIINTASKHLHNDLARAIKALEQKKTTPFSGHGQDHTRWAKHRLTSSVRSRESSKVYRVGQIDPKVKWALCP